jgi:hypothetical protein
MYDDPKSKISQLEKILDTREDLISKKIKRHELHDRDINVATAWDDQEFINQEVKPSDFAPEKKRMSFPIKILIGSIIFFIIALILVAYKFLGGGNLVSGNNIEIAVKAPISVTGGEVFPFEINIKNNNNITLSAVDLGVTFPLGAKDVQNTSLPAKMVQTFLGNILPGQSVKKNLSVVLLGQENDKKNIDINLAYKVPGSNSVFNKKKTIQVLISSAPISLVITGPDEVNTNQNVDFTAEITSNSPSVVKDLLLKIDYPFGFVFSESNPKTFSKNNLWLIGDLEPGAKRVIKFSGTLTGQEGEERGFNFSLGSQSKNDNQVIDIPLTSAFSAVTIRRPFVSADILFNGSDTKEYVSPAGEKVEATINWQNNLPYEVSDVSILIRINGNAVNKASIIADSGYYRSSDNTIAYNKTTDSDLAVVEPGQSGSSKLTFSSFGVGTITGGALTNPTIVLDILVTGKRVDYQPGQDDILFSDSRKIKITSNPQLFAKALYYVGPFENTGPVPPKSEQETTYTITWTVTNPLNNLTNTKVTAVLPPYVKYLSVISPTKENISYEESTGLVTWSPGNILAGAGKISPAKEVSFQISFLPSVDKIGVTPELIGPATITAKDTFTLTDTSSVFQALNTNLTSDPYFKDKDQTVVK